MSTRCCATTGSPNSAANTPAASVRNDELKEFYALFDKTFLGLFLVHRR